MWVNSTIVQERVHVSKQTALNLIGQLEDTGVLLKAKGEERNRAWVTIDIVNEFDRFAERSGRRSRKLLPTRSITAEHRSPPTLVGSNGQCVAT